MSKKLPIDEFTWETGLSIFADDFIKNYDFQSDIGYIFYADITFLNNFMNYIKIYRFYQIEWKLIKLISLSLVYMIKKIILYIFML